MARSLARALALRSTALLRRPAARVVRGEGVELALEGLHVSLHRTWRPAAVAHPQHDRAEHAEHQEGDEEDDRTHGEGAPTSATSWAHADQSSPPSHVSRFQIGTVVLTVSMA